MQQVEVKSSLLSNGMQVTTMRLPWAKSIAIGIWFKAGSAYECEDELGMAHFVEHLLFKGTKRHTGRRIAQVVDELGAYLEAFTERELTCYYARVLPDGLSKMLRLMAELVSEPEMSVKDIKVEQDVVLSEISEVNDTPEELVQELLLEALWDGHPLARPVLGKPESVKSFTAKSVKSFLKRFYTPDNAVVTASGCLEHERFVEELQKAFGSFNGKAQVPKLFPPVPKPQLKIAKREIAQAYVCIGSHGFSQRQRKRFLCMVLLDFILGGNASSRFFQSIRERLGLAYSIGSVSIGMRDAGFLVILFNCLPENVEKTAVALRHEIQKLLENGIRKSELRRAKAQLRSSLTMSLESVMGQMLQMGRQLIYFNKLIPSEELLSNIDSITPEDVMETAFKLFERGKLAVSFVGSLDPLKVEKIAKILTEF
ncbi:MAG: pitrilysin family protein [Armatimonadota bacterium]|nr:insulinase family protein [Armatimonadota bacterium]MCX7777369.1 insulinase family protein [Armatimonadota bacterium]MDW8025363.1 pitrilysin family protein [Armatimonadota bacterium]